MPTNSPIADRIRMRHMLDAAQQALDFARGRSRADLDGDAMFRRAVTHCIQEIGEAAGHVSEATRAGVPAVPWRQVVGMRHNLVHAYFNIKHEAVWQVLSRELQPLIDSLEAYLAAPPPADDLEAGGQS